MWELLKQLYTGVLNADPVNSLSVTASVSFVCGVVIWLLRGQNAASKDWTKWFSLAYFAYAATYALRAIVVGTLGMSQDSFLYLLVGAAGITLNHVFFYVSARWLRDRQPILPTPFVVSAVICAAVRLLEGFDFGGARFPSTFLAIYCLGQIGYALATNFSINRRTAGFGVVVSYFITTCYGLIELLWATNLLIGRLDMDKMVVTWLIPFKLGLFFIAFTVLLRSVTIISSEKFQKLLASLANSNEAFVGNGSFLGQLGNDVGAENVQLTVRLPGAKSPEVIQYEWECNQQDQPSPKVFPLADLNDSETGSVLKNGKEIIWRNRKEFVDGESGRILLPEEDQRKLVALPVRFQEKVVACLRVVAPGRRAFGAVAVNHLRHLTNLSAISAQQVRGLSAADQVSEEFSYWRVGTKKIEIGKALKKFAVVLQNAFAPFKVKVDVEVGFEAYCKEGDEEGSKDSFNDLSYRVEQVPLKMVKGEQNNDDDSDEQSNSVTIGKVSFIIPQRSKMGTPPPLGLNEGLKRVVGALASDALLDIARDHFANVLRDFVLDLNAESMNSAAQWHNQIQATATRAGLCWAVARDLTKDEWLNKSALTSALSRYLLPEIPVSPDGSSIKYSSLSPTIENAASVILVRLPQTNIQIYFGVKRQGFGAELGTSSPWYVFIDRFSDIADAALLRMRSVLEMQQLQMETADAQGLAAAAVTMETLFHQLTNMVRDIAIPIKAVEDSLKLKQLIAGTEDRECIHSASNSADKLLSFAGEMMNVTKLDAHRPCSLQEAAEQSRRLFEDGLKRNGVKLEINVDAAYLVDVPFHVASLAFANLVSNGKDVIGTHGGHITINARKQDGWIVCDVTDDGPGISPKMREKDIFALGITTKERSGGWGLYLTRRSLIENHASLELTKPGPGGTTFTIRFPKYESEISR